MRANSPLPYRQRSLQKFKCAWRWRWGGGTAKRTLISSLESEHVGWIPKCSCSAPAWPLCHKLPRCQLISLGRVVGGEVEQVVPSGELGSLMGKLHDLDIQKTSLAMVQIFKHTSRGLGPNRFHRASTSHSTPNRTPSSGQSQRGSRGPVCRFSPQGTRTEFSLQGRDSLRVLLRSLTVGSPSSPE